MPAGRPTKYEDTHPDRAYKLALLGMDDAEIAEIFGIAESTLNLWKIEHPKFLESIQKGKGPADANVAASLYERACGYSHAEDKIFPGNSDDGPLIVPTVKHYPPDTAAAFIWLKNRQRGKWRDRSEKEIYGKDGGPVEFRSMELAIHEVDAESTD